MFWYVYSSVGALEGKPVLGDGQCVTLVQKLTNVGHTSTWSPGLRVMDSVHLPIGCVIATFVDGKWPNKKTGNHACFFLGYGPASQSTGKPTYIQVMDQWASAKRPHIQSRKIAPYGLSELRIASDSDNADMFYVVNHLP
jgi:hypothetical protein